MWLDAGTPRWPRSIGYWAVAIPAEAQAVAILVGAVSVIATVVTACVLTWLTSSFPSLTPTFLFLNIDLSVFKIFSSLGLHLLIVHLLVLLPKVAVHT